jgi:hypothetical protein
MGQERTWVDRIYHPFPWNYDTPEEYFYYRGLGKALWGIPVIVGLVVALFGHDKLGNFSPLGGIISAFASVPFVSLLLGKMDSWLKKREKMKQLLIEEEKQRLDKITMESWLKKNK